MADGTGGSGGAVTPEGEAAAGGTVTSEGGVMSERPSAGVYEASGAEPAGARATEPAALRAKAAGLDAVDRLAEVRDRFAVEGVVTATGTPEIYLDGNSLGALPHAVPERLDDVVRREWGALRIRSWHGSGWWRAPERIGDRIAPLVGAGPGQIVVCDSTSVNVFKALTAAVRMADQDAADQRPASGEHTPDAGRDATSGHAGAPGDGVSGHGGAPHGGASSQEGALGHDGGPGRDGAWGQDGTWGQDGGAGRDRALGIVRDEILVDATTFPSDGYIAASVARMTGRALRTVAPDELPDALGPRTAAVLVNHVDYLTGRLNDLPRLTAAVRAAGAYAVWDLCHSAGALPVGLDEHGVDLAVGCTYKFLNGGPGSPAFLYVRRDLQRRFDSPLPGWNSHEVPFGMRDDYVPAQGAIRGRVGTPDILSMLAFDAALDVWEGVSIAQVRAKSLALTDFFMECVAAYVPAGRVEVITPRTHPERGSQVSLRTPDADAVMARLIARGVVGDHRPPDVLRFGFTPLYLTFTETERAAAVLAEELAS